VGRNPHAQGSLYSESVKFYMVPGCTADSQVRAPAWSAPTVKGKRKDGSEKLATAMVGSKEVEWTCQVPNKDDASKTKPMKLMLSFWFLTMCTGCFDQNNQNNVCGGRPLEGGVFACGVRLDLSLVTSTSGISNIDREATEFAFSRSSHFLPEDLAAAWGPRLQIASRMLRVCMAATTFQGTPTLPRSSRAKSCCR
jgi:hypothetical protein